MANKNNGKKWALGALLAAAAGYVTGVLTAPKSGKETREDIKNTAKKTVDEAKQQLNQLHSELDKRVAEAKKVGEKLTGKAKDEFANVMDTANKAKEKAKELLASAGDGEAQDVDLKKAIADADKALKDLKRFLRKD